MSQDAQDEKPRTNVGEDSAEIGEEETGGAVGGGEELSELESLRQEAEENLQKYLRTAAELENVRKRSTRDVENARRYGLERLARALLPVKDSLEAGLASGEKAEVEALLDGKRATLRLLDSALEQVGIEELDPEGEPFDPAKHEAMTVQPSDTAEPNSVLSVIQKGYAIYDRLLRPARVVVAGEPAAEDESQ